MNLGKITHANVYVDGKEWLGVGEVKLPKIEHEKLEIKNLSLMGDLEIPKIKLKPLNGEIKLESYDTQVFPKVLNPKQAVMLDIRASRATYFHDRGTIEDVPVVLKLRAFFVSTDNASLKVEGEDEKTLEYSAIYLKLTVNGEEILEIDPVNWVYNIQGNDIVSAVRRALGK